MAKKIITIAYNATKAKLFNADHAAKVIMVNLLSYFVEGYEKTTRFVQGRWDGKETFYDIIEDRFPVGFVDIAIQELVDKGYEVQVAAKEAPEPLGNPDCKVDNYAEQEMYDYQRKSVEKLVKMKRMICRVATGGGKCLGYDTPVLMFNGTVKKVQDIKVGDKLIGADSKERNVLSICRGRENLYKITPTKGDAYIVNESHILSLKITPSEKGEKHKVVNISVKDYLKQNSSFKHRAKGWRTGVVWNTKPLLDIDPYVLGVWLGDGSNRSAEIYTPDKEIKKYLIDYFSKYGQNIRITPQRGCEKISISDPEHNNLNKLSKFLKNNNLNYNKHIPHIFKTAMQEDRLSLLAGLIDTDGYLHNNFYEIVSKYKVLAEDIAFLARSLGFAAYITKQSKRIKGIGFEGEYYKVSISGEVDKIPCKVPHKQAYKRKQIKDVLVTGIKVEPLGEGDYYGFELDGDHLFLLGDFTVTHNTRIAKIAHARIGRRTLFLTTRDILAKQMKNGIDKDGIFTTGFIGGGKYEPDMASFGFTTAMVQTLAERLKEPQSGDNSSKAMRQLRIREKTIEFLESIDFIIGEEAQEAGGNNYFDVLSYCKNAHYRLALTATPFMRDGAESNMRLMAQFGNIGINISEKFLIDRGILAKPYFIYYKNKSDNKFLSYTTPWQRAIEIGIVDNDNRNNKILNFCSKNVDYGLTTIILLTRKEHGRKINLFLKNNGINSEFIDGDSSDEERQKWLSALENKEIDVLIGTTILDVGVDVPSVGALVLAGGGKAEVGLRQRIGRTLRKKKIFPNVSLVLDFEDKGNKHLITHSQTRKNIVKNTPGFGENIIEAEDFDYEALGFKKVR